MKDVVRPPHRPLDGRGVGDVATHEFNLVPDRGQVFLLPRDQVIEHAHAVAAGKESLDQMRADEAGAAGDERDGQMTKSE